MSQKDKYSRVHIRKGTESFKKKSYKHLSMIIDGMDQDKTNVPHHWQKPKQMASVVPYKCCVIGVIVHGFEARAWVVEPFWKHDTDLTIEIIVRTLLRIIDAGHKLAPVLYLQMDNCWRENKNQHVFTFLSLLVKLGIFTKIKLNFDLVGHTHEDVDQMFRALNLLLAKSTLRTVEELIAKLVPGYANNSYGIPFSVERLNAVGLYKNWQAPLEKGMHNHTLPHCFKVPLFDLFSLLLFQDDSILPLCHRAVVGSLCHRVIPAPLCHRVGPGCRYAMPRLSCTHRCQDAASDLTIELLSLAGPLDTLL